MSHLDQLVSAAHIICLFNQTANFKVLCEPSNKHTWNYTVKNHFLRKTIHLIFHWSEVSINEAR